LPGGRYERRRAFLFPARAISSDAVLATAPKTRFQSNDAEPGVSRRKRLIFHVPHSSDGIVRGEDRNRGSKMDTRGARADGGEKYLR